MTPVKIILGLIILLTAGVALFYVGVALGFLFMSLVTAIWGTAF